MSKSQSIISHIVIGITFFNIWSRIVLDGFYSFGKILHNLPKESSLILAIAVPFILLFLVLYFKSTYAYGFTMCLFAIMILISLGHLPELLNHHLLYLPDHVSVIVPMNGLENCIKTLANASIGFALMNTKTLRQTYSWNSSTSRFAFLFTSIFYFAGWIAL